MQALRSFVRSVYARYVPMRAKVKARRGWVRLARRAGRPISSPQLPRPALDAARKPLRLSHVLVACDLSARYLGSWELIRRAWPEVCGVEPLLVLIAHEGEVPPELLADERVVRFDPIADVPTALQAQCIRLLYPPLVEADGAVLISDMELVPLDPRYFHEPIGALDDRFFVPYRDIVLDRRQVAIPYNAARPETWGEVFGVSDLDDVRRRLTEWTQPIFYDGVRGGSGWYTDQERLFEYLMPWGRETGRLWMLDDDFTGFSRLEREDLEAHGLTAAHRSAILASAYTDFNSLVPHGERRDVNEPVLELALESLARHRPRRRSAGVAS